MFSCSVRASGFEPDSWTVHRHSLIPGPRGAARVPSRLRSSALPINEVTPALRTWRCREALLLYQPEFQSIRRSLGAQPLSFSPGFPTPVGFEPTTTRLEGEELLVCAPGWCISFPSGLSLRRSGDVFTIPRSRFRRLIVSQHLRLHRLPSRLPKTDSKLSVRRLKHLPRRRSPTTPTRITDV